MRWHVEKIVTKTSLRSRLRDLSREVIRTQEEKHCWIREARKPSLLYNPNLDSSRDRGVGQSGETGKRACHMRGTCSKYKGIRGFMSLIEDLEPQAVHYTWIDSP